MAKYNYRVIADDKTWSAEIIRKQTSKKIHVTRKKDKFTTEKEAVEWAKTELDSFVSILNERRRTAKLKS